MSEEHRAWHPVTQSGESAHSTNWTNAHWIAEVWQSRASRWHTAKEAWAMWGEEYGDVRLKNKSICSMQVALFLCFTKPHLPRATCGGRHKMAVMGRCEVRWQGSFYIWYPIILVMNCFMAGTGMHWEGPRSSGVLGLLCTYSQEPTVKFSELLQTSC